MLKIKELTDASPNSEIVVHHFVGGDKGDSPETRLAASQKESCRGSWGCGTVRPTFVLRDGSIVRNLAEIEASVGARKANGSTEKVVHLIEAWSSTNSLNIDNLEAALHQKHIPSPKPNASFLPVERAPADLTRLLVGCPSPTTAQPF